VRTARRAPLMTGRDENVVSQGGQQDEYVHRGAILGVSPDAAQAGLWYFPI
jgi:hypothetical protein